MKRESFLTSSIALVAASGAVASAQSAPAVPGGTNFVETAADFDLSAFGAKLGRPADIRQLFEAVAFKPGILDNMKNSLNGLQFGFGHAADGIALALAGHGPSASYGYSDYVWAKYRIGEFFKIVDASGAAIASNIYLPAKAKFDPKSDPNDPAAMYQDTSIEMLQRRGVVVLTCHTAVEEQSRSLVKGGFAPAGMTPKDVASDILTHLIPGAVVVPAMVAAIAVLQAKHHYTYVALTF